MSGGALGFWGRVGVVTIGSSIVLVTVIVVVICIVGRNFCAITSSLFSRDKTQGKKKIKSEEKVRLFDFDPQLVYYRTSEPLQGYNPSQPSNKWTSVPEDTNVHGGQNGTLSPPFSCPPATADNPLLGSLATMRDSTYSSMSENSDRTSPSGSCRQSSVEGSSCSGGVSMLSSPTGVETLSSPTGVETQGQISFSVQFVLTNEERGTGKLLITILNARGLQGRQYVGGACDPYVKVIIWRERRSLRKHKSPPLHVYRTRTVRHTTSPSFNETFIVEVSKSELKELMLKVVAMDCDKWVSPSTLGEVVQPLRDIKSLPTNADRTLLNFFLAPAKLDFGEILFGLSYLPTAQRLSVSVIKANHLKYTNVVPDITDFCPYVRVLLISPNGRVIRKKKTTFGSNTDKPIWNETLIFDMPQNLIENVTFIMVVCSRILNNPSDPGIETIVNTEIEDSLHLSPLANPPSMNGSPAHDSCRKLDKYVGKVVLGCKVSGEEERKHWLQVLAAPRKVTSQWHSLK